MTRLARPCIAALLALSMTLSIAACDQPHMEDQAKYETFEAAPEWADDQSALTPVPGSVARDARLGPVPDELPMPLTAELLERGRERFNIYCSPCHARTGSGHGMVVQRGFPQPPTFHSERLRQAPLRHFYDVISDGFGVMYAYRDRVAPEDRWAIAAYIRALQLARHASLADVPADVRQRLKRGDATKVTP
ncbi:Cytochrome C oxidase, cbb3-type, subunit III [Modicisalibacter muralis]|uniref:Cytochrome C oxidase, cbb3-type, subunit III n=1 Tax=Modicisalibacter muralis TaxID=119000 RepID=A0A1G9MEH2_9GAMM|nr:cytochrome c [Halomonas muralis]SDL72065.1 Cytochrome C oxidase, cbb3-type, subunit III [Halomonas muralis]